MSIVTCSQYRAMPSAVTRSSSSTSRWARAYAAGATGSQRRRSGRPERPRSGAASKLEQLPGRRDDPLDRGHVRVLDLPVRVRHVEAGDAQHWAAQVENRLLGEDRRELAREAI